MIYVVASVVGGLIVLRLLVGVFTGIRNRRDMRAHYENPVIEWTFAGGLDDFGRRLKMMSSALDLPRDGQLAWIAQVEASEEQSSRQTRAGFPLKIFNEDDPEQGRLYAGLRVTSKESTSDTEKTPPPQLQEAVLVQPNIPDRGRRTALTAQLVAREQGRTGPSSPTPPSNPYEEQEQAILQQHGADKAWITRGPKGLVESIVVGYPDGSEDLVLHSDSGQPVTEHFVTLSPGTASPDASSSVPPRE
jgi:hypothetical protein